MASNATIGFEQPRPMSGAEIAPPLIRHPLGIPPGSVRAILILMVIAMVWLMLAMPPEKHVTVPLYLYYLLFLTVGAYFASRSRSENADGHPLHLPRGCVRLLIIAGTVGVILYALYQNPNVLDTALVQANEKPTLLLPLVLLGAFLVGVVSSALGERVFAGAACMPAWWQDIQAWMSLMAMLGLGAQMLLELLIFPNLDPGQRPQMPHLRLVLSAVIAFYFGTRV